MHRLGGGRGPANGLMRPAGATLLMLPALLGLAGCAPIPVEQAERLCLSRARDAIAPRGEIGLGVGSEGYRGGYVQLDISSDYIRGRDPAQVFYECVRSRSGQPPTRPLSEQPGWAGR